MAGAGGVGPSPSAGADPPSPVEAEYDRLAPRYDRRWARYLRASIEEALASLDPAPGARLLDVGCGTGLLLDKLLSRRPDVAATGVELSPGMLGRARARLGERATLIRASAEKLPFPGASFDVLVSTSMFHYLLEPEAALREWRRVLRPEGRLVLTDWCRDFRAMRLLDLWLRLSNRAHQHTFSTAEIRRLLEAAGFRVTGIHEHRAGPFWGLMTCRCERVG